MINLWFLFIAAEVWRNYHIIEKNKVVPNYLQSFILRGMASILHGIAVGVVNTKEYALLIVFQCCSFWIIFDIALNLSRGKSPIHRGKKGWIAKIPEDGYWVLKVAALVLGVVTYNLVK